jgi:hypothetical protein
MSDVLPKRLASLSSHVSPYPGLLHHLPHLARQQVDSYVRFGDNSYEADLSGLSMAVCGRMTSVTAKLLTWTPTDQSASYTSLTAIYGESGGSSHGPYCEMIMN